MIKGTRVLFGEDARLYLQIIAELKNWANTYEYQEIILPAIWEQQTFIDKAGPEVLGQMYAFKDKGERDICLIPEATAVVQSLFKEDWNKNMKKPVKVFYVQKCYRYERPQAGRYREFTQFGVECLGGNMEQNTEQVREMLLMMMSGQNVEWKFNASVKRGLDYYTEDGFEVEIEKLGAQKQVAGGGRYDCGVGFAIGVDRLLLALKK